ncbi:RWD domain-containing protein 4 [Culicoides brevitarsis]|uniref:RWD domain-containing protein 4 n=1 Tax=Culicoides brevitarsis TaxID=469753 RepID=UPI00307B7018
MSETKEMQTDEREALISIYEGDEQFKEVNSTTFQYRYGETDTIKSFLMEISWPENYPNELPNVNLELFYNRNLPSAVKLNISKIVLEEAQQWIGCGMTFSLFECLKDKLDDILADVNTIEKNIDVATESVADLEIDQGEAGSKAAKKEHLTKAQKRRLWDKTDHTGTKPRGWDWVDIIKHLSQTGNSKGDDVTTN